MSTVGENRQITLKKEFLIILLNNSFFSLG